jgi:hypothetical protein
LKLRIALFIIAILLGLAGGLYYGWVINPAQSPDTSLADLRLDYKTDYVLMTAEAYQAEHSLDVAAARLSRLGDEEPVYLARQMYLVARDAGYPAADLKLIDDLAIALQTWTPGATPTAGVTP